MLSDPSTIETDVIVIGGRRSGNLHLSLARCIDSGLHQPQPMDHSERLINPNIMS